jgi:uncharacterized protein YjbI with pentapeptide repeats
VGRTLDETWSFLEARGDEVPRTPAGAPLIPKRRPRFDDDVLGFSVFRTKLVGDWSSLTLPRTYFGRSLVERVNFYDTDLSESVACWNDFVEVVFSSAVLDRADLRASTFQDCSFDRASLVEADLRRSSFFGCSFLGADLRGALAERRAAWLSGVSDHQRASMTLTDSEGEEPPGG